MSYTLKLTNGKILLTLPDQQSDSISTSLTLIGKNVNAYGTDLNDNFIKLLENFANTSEPTSPLIGQLWFNTVEQRLYVYNAALEFRPAGGPIVSAIQPVGLAAGDMWIDTTARQLKFYDGSNLLVAGPAYDYSKGKSGWVIENVIDNVNGEHTVVGLYANGTLQGILSDVAFVLRSDFQTSTGMTSVGVGFTAKAPMKFIGTATNAEAVNGIAGINILDLSTTTNQTMQAPMWIYNDEGLTIGTNGDIQLFVTGTSRTTTLALAGVQDFDFLAATTTGTLNHIFYYNALNQCLGVFNTDPQVGVDVKGDVRIQGNLEVYGSSTYITSADLRVENKVIEMGYSDTITTDVMANGGGLELHGDTVKAFKWYESTDAWTASTNIDVSSGSNYKVGGVEVINGNSLGAAIIAAPGLHSVGVLNSLTVGVIHMENYSIGTNNGAPLLLGVAPTTSLDVQGLKIHNVGNINYLDSGDIATNKAYVDSAVSVARAGQFAPTIDVTGHANTPEDPSLDIYVIALLQLLLPPGDPSPYGVPENGRARVLVTRYQSGAITAVSDNIGFNSESVYRAGTSTPVNVVQYQSTYVATTTVPSRNLAINRAIKQYIVSGGVWIRLIYTGSSNTVWSDGTW